MTVTLTYTNHEGLEKTVSYEDDVEKISNLQWEGFSYIDLTPLESCTNLKMLLLNGNRLDRIDLSPLSSCINFERLSLRSNRLNSINLKPIASCQNLQRLDLYDNKLENIDLKPLQSCRNMRYLNLIKNKLKVIDLSPLRFWKNLISLSLDDNQLKSIDLTSLRKCKSLEGLHIEKNHVKDFDLTPLAMCRNLKRLELAGNQLSGIDLSPLFRCSHLKSLMPGVDFQPLDLTILATNESDPHVYHRGIKISWLSGITRISRRIGDSVYYHRPQKADYWPFLHHVAKKFGKNRRVQHDILYAMNLGDYGFIDSDLQECLIAIPPKSDIEEARKQIEPVLVKEIVSAVENGGSTTGLKLEEIAIKHPEILVLFQRIHELRMKEMKQVEIAYVDDRLDLRNLWLTSFGYEILNFLDYVHDFPKEFVLQNIQEAFEAVGFEIRIGDGKSPALKMSHELKECIWWIARNRDRSWFTIDRYEKEKESAG